MKVADVGKIGFIGAGKMAEGIMKGLIKSGLFKPGEIVAADIDKSRLASLSKLTGVATASNLKVAESCNPIFLAIKPQQAQTAFKELAEAPLEDKVFLSIMAGVPTQRIEHGLKASVHVIRIMPNIAATVQAAASAYCLGKWATEEDAELSRTLLETFGTATQVDEKLMDAVTGLSGSGPAYVLAFIEALSDGGVMMGLPRNTALTLAVQTVLGAAKLLMDTAEHPVILRENVTSPGGTTSYGLAEMEACGFKNAIIQAVRRATERSKTLGKES